MLLCHKAQLAYAAVGPEAAAAPQAKPVRERCVACGVGGEWTLRFDCFAELSLLLPRTVRLLKIGQSSCCLVVDCTLSGAAGVAELVLLTLQLI